MAGLLSGSDATERRQRALVGAGRDAAVAHRPLAHRVVAAERHRVGRAAAGVDSPGVAGEVLPASVADGAGNAAGRTAAVAVDLGGDALEQLGAVLGVVQLRQVAVGMGVDEAGRREEASRVDALRVRRVEGPGGPDVGDPAVLDEDVLLARVAPRAVADPAAEHEYSVFHGNSLDFGFGLLPLKFFKPRGGLFPFERRDMELHLHVAELRAGRGVVDAGGAGGLKGFVEGQLAAFHINIITYCGDILRRDVLVKAPVVSLSKCW